MGGRPTLSEAQSWRPDSVRHAADAWDAAATDTHREFDVLVLGVQDTQDFWTGDAADAARERAETVSGITAKLACALVAAAVAARNGADQIAAARDGLLAQMVSVRSLGFTVADDGTVAPPAQPPAFLLEQCAGNAGLAANALSAMAVEYTREIVAKLDALGAADDDATHDIDDAFHG